ncbi:hypothetical protein DUNSADRAFT_1695 [Dunaliella salina]|uniref:Secreted protein n=1 Tax=Dunaliella salina TaxID=3046 RepID=A0ABQ7GWT6_DUNSA|nr:hypothetical protein DUNSADRAFT_1695 [Dunaliella salina]|eukprot:KAF5839078.1 hypothetical protein DUNSADRAFT_1695 [Dunaliella salina]
MPSAAAISAADLFAAAHSITVMWPLANSSSKACGCGGCPSKCAKCRRLWTMVPLTRSSRSGCAGHRSSSWSPLLEFSRSPLVDFSWSPLVDFSRCSTFENRTNSEAPSNACAAEAMLATMAGAA